MQGSSNSIHRTDFRLPKIRAHRPHISSAAAKHCHNSVEQGTECESDEDGLDRKYCGDTVTVYHTLSTALEQVGCQVWTASLWLYDWFLEHAVSHGTQVWTASLRLCDWLLENPELISNGVQVLELGAGVGLPSITAATLGARVWLTDAEPAALALAQRSAEANTRLICKRGGCVVIRMLDWKEPVEWDVLCSTSESAILALPKSCVPEVATRAESEVSSIINRAPVRPFATDNGGGAIDGSGAQPAAATERFRCMTSADWQSLCDCKILMAADVIYDADSTEAFCSFVLNLLLWRKKFSAGCGNLQPATNPLPRVILAAQRRVCFTLQEQAACAPAIDFFWACLECLRRDDQRLHAEILDTKSVPMLLSDPQNQDLVLMQLSLVAAGGDNQNQ